MSLDVYCCLLRCCCCLPDVLVSFKFATVGGWSLVITFLVMFAWKFLSFLSVTYLYLAYFAAFKLQGIAAGEMFALDITAAAKQPGTHYCLSCLGVVYGSSNCPGVILLLLSSHGLRPALAVCSFPRRAFLCWAFVADRRCCTAAAAAAFS